MIVLCHPHCGYDNTAMCTHMFLTLNVFMCQLMLIVPVDLHGTLIPPVPRTAESSLLEQLLHYQCSIQWLMFVLKSMALHLPWSHFGSCRRATYAKDTAAGGRCYLLP